MVKHLRTINCTKCGIEITGKHTIPPFIDARTLHIDLQGFYGNRVKKFMHVKCDCGKKYIAFMEVSRNTYTIIDLAEDNLEEEVIPFADNNIAQKTIVRQAFTKRLSYLSS